MLSACTQPFYPAIKIAVDKEIDGKNTGLKLQIKKIDDKNQKQQIIKSSIQTQMNGQYLGRQ